MGNDVLTYLEDSSATLDFLLSYSLSVLYTGQGYSPNFTWSGL